MLLVLEDLHFAFLGRNLRDAAVAMVLTYRAEEVTRRHPLRPVLANLERDGQVERVELTGLDRAELEALLDEICESPMDVDAIDVLAARSGGNPFYVEELVAAGAVDAVAHGLPSRISDVVLARVAALSTETQDVLRAAAVVGDEVDDDLLAAVAGRPVTGMVREAVEHGLVVFDGTTFRFRHALVREALYDDLLPGERTRLHVASARAIERADKMAEHTRWAKLAHHWDAAHDISRAYAASIRAAVEAERVHALADAGAQYERALALRDQVPDAEVTAGMTRVDLLLRACDAVRAGTRGGRALVLAQTALREMPAETAPERRALVYERIGRINWTLHRGPAAVAAYEAGAALVADSSPSREKAFVLSALGQSLMLRQLYREALQVLCLYAGGRYDDAVAELGAAIEYVVRSGHVRYYGQAAAGHAILSLYCAGRWDDAERLHDDRRIPNGEAYQELRWLPLLFGAGRLDEARDRRGDVRRHCRCR